MSRGRRTLAGAVDRVVARGNCSGCGACAALEPTIEMELDARGYLRPVIDPDVAVPRSTVDLFRRICPGVSVTAARPPGSVRHPTMGPAVSVWFGWAGDPDVRWRGSSAGVLTAMTQWLLASGTAHTVVGASMSTEAPTRTVALELQTRDQVLAAAGSRYAPVGTASRYDPSDQQRAFVGKPCEVSAARAWTEMDQRDAPVLLSFFCAGVPSQTATDQLVTSLGVEPPEATSVRYRGNGWPGPFEVRGKDGAERRLSYEESWGSHLGRAVQSRCKVCPDGTGEHADIAVGDFWRTDDAGYPLFEDAKGECVVVARTQKGHELLAAARAQGVVILEPGDLNAVAAVQPLQVARRLQLRARLAGRFLAGKPGPRVRGFATWRSVFRDPRRAVRALRGTYARTRREVRDTDHMNFRRGDDR